MLTKQQTEELNLLTYDYNALVNKKGPWTKADDARAANFQVQIANVKAGGSTKKPSMFLTTQDEEEIRAFQSLVLEGRGTNATEGAPMNAQIGSYSGLGYFVPTGYYDQLFAAMKQHDKIFFDDSYCAVIKTPNANPLPVPLASDTENNLASVSTEAGSQTQTDVDSTNHAVLNGYIYNTRRMVFSLEAMQDTYGAASCYNLFKKFMAESFARGLTADLLLGSGTNRPYGLIPSLIEGEGQTPVIAQGSAFNDGSGNTGANSIGSEDIQGMYSQLDDAYDNSHTAWLMNRHTLATLGGALDKFGNIVNLVKWYDGQPTIFGIPVVISPSMESVGVSQYSVILGDFSYWATRIIIPEGPNVQVYREAPGLVENGNFGMRASLRGDGALLWTDTGSPCPFVVLQHYS
jgi:HK97 family phage major capsid protein